MFGESPTTATISVRPPFLSTLEGSDIVEDLRQVGVGMYAHYYATLNQRIREGGDFRSLGCDAEK